VLARASILVGPAAGSAGSADDDPHPASVLAIPRETKKKPFVTFMLAPKQ